MSPRQRALVKILAAFVGFFLLTTAIRLIRHDGEQVGKLAMLPVAFVALAWVALLEVILGTSFTNVSSAWNRLPAWKQWPLAAFLFFAFFLIWLLFAAATPFG